jgi:hypothetical protein
MIGRLQERQALLPGNPVEALYGPQAAIGPASHPVPVVLDSSESGLADYEQIVEPDEYIEEGEIDDPAVALSELAIAAENGLAAVVPSGTYKGKSLKEMLEARPATDAWFVKALQHDWKGQQFGADVYAVVRAHAADLIGEAS